MTIVERLEEGTVHVGPRLIAEAPVAAVGIGNAEMAKKAGLRGRIVPNTLHFAQLNDLLLALVGLDWLNGGQIEVQYRAPLYDGDEIVAKARVSSNKLAADGRLEFEVWCENQDGLTLARGTASWSAEGQPFSNSPNEIAGATKGRATS